MSLSERGTIHIKPWIKLNNNIYYIYIPYQNLLLSSFLSFSRNPLSSIQLSLKYLDLKIKKKLKYINIKLMILKESHALKIHEIVPRDIPKQYYFYYKVENTLPYM